MRRLSELMPTFRPVATQTPGSPSRFAFNRYQPAAAELQAKRNAGAWKD